MLIPTRILVPTDFSQFSDKALEQALDIAIHYKAKVYLFHVAPALIQPCVIDYCFSVEIVKILEEQTKNTASDNLRKQLEKFPQRQKVEVIAEIGTGLPYEAILKEAEDKGIDLIVIASLGKSGIAKYLIGGVARNVLKGAKCPVLLTK